MEENKVENTKLDELKKKINTLKGKLTTLEEKKKDLENKAKELIAKTIYEKKQEIERSYDEVLREAEVRLKATEKEKESEKKKNLDRVVEHNTRSTREDNTYLKNEINKILRDNKLPGFVNSGFYMALWYPKSIGSIFGVFIAVIIVLLIPTLLSFVIYKKELLVQFPNSIIRYIVIALIYLAFIFVFGLIWLIIDKLTKKNIAALDNIIELRKNIEENKTKIANITRETTQNMNDSEFDYTKLDREIEAERMEVENYKKKKKEAVDNFVNVTQDEITKGIESAASKDIDAIVNEMDEVKAELSTVQTEHDELKLKMATE